MAIFKKLIGLEQEAADYGFKWENPRQIIQQIVSECNEIEESLNIITQDDSALKEEVGDLMHAVFSLCIFLKFDPEAILENSAQKFERRFQLVKLSAEAQGLTTLKGLPFESLVKLWEAAKVQAGKDVT